MLSDFMQLNPDYLAKNMQQLLAQVSVTVQDITTRLLSDKSIIVPWHFSHAFPLRLRHGRPSTWPSRLEQYDDKDNSINWPERKLEHALGIPQGSGQLSRDEPSDPSDHRLEGSFFIAYQKAIDA